MMYTGNPMRVPSDCRKANPDAEPTIIKAGWGYWDLTNYPRGGCFRRLSEDTTIVVDAVHNGEYYGKLPDGRRICISIQAAVPQVMSEQASKWSGLDPAETE